MMGQEIYTAAFPVHLYGVMIALGIGAAIWIIWLETLRYKENADHIFNLVMILIPLGVIGARLYHVIDRWDYFMANPGDIIGGQGLGIFGAVIAGAIGLIVYTKWRKISTLRWLDIVAPGLLLAQAIGRWGNYFNQELYGYPTSLPWGIHIDPPYRLPGYEEYTTFHPMFFYEFAWNLAGFGLIMLLARRLHGWLLKGDVFLFYAMWYGTGRFILEGYKIDVWTAGGMPVARWISLFAVVASVAVFILRHVKKKVMV